MPSVTSRFLRGGSATGVMALNKTEYAQRVKSLRPGALLAYWPLWDGATGTVMDISGRGFNATSYNVTPTQAGIGDGRGCFSFNGSNSYVNAGVAGFLSAFNTNQGTAMIWFKPAAGAWSDSTNRKTFYVYYDSNNYAMTLLKSSTTNNWSQNFDGASTVETVTGAAIPATGLNGWTCAVSVWDRTGANTYTVYHAGRYVSQTTTLGTWAGQPVGAFIGSNDATPTQGWNGWLAHCAIWTAPLTAAEVNELARVR